MITVHFQGETWDEIDAQMRRAIGVPTPARTEAPMPRFDEFPDDAMTEDEVNAATFAHNMAKDDNPPRADIPKPKRSHKKAAPAPAQTTTEPAPEPEPEPTPEPDPAPVDPALPTLDALKALVTKAVRLAQKGNGEGDKKLLNLLADFKVKTKLEYIMNAEEPHYAALAELVDQAGLAAV